LDIEPIANVKISFSTSSIWKPRIAANMRHVTSLLFYT
jgi:hypothetical protein